LVYEGIVDAVAAVPFGGCHRWEARSQSGNLNYFLHFVSTLLVLVVDAALPVFWISLDAFGDRLGISFRQGQLLKSRRSAGTPG
jgi:hypothetical protein